MGQSLLECVQSAVGHRRGVSVYIGSDGLKWLRLFQGSEVGEMSNSLGEYLS